MTEEERQDRAIEYVLGTMDAAAERAFRESLADNPELAIAVADLTEGFAAMAHSVPLHLPPSHLRGRILEITRSEAPAPILVASKPRRNWLPWTVGAGLAVCCALLGIESLRLRRHVEAWRGHTADWKREAETRLREAAEADEAAHALDQRAEALQKQGTALEVEIAQLRSRDVLADITVAILRGQNDALANARAVVLWDEQKQRGLLEAVALPAPEAGRAYQLWALDPRYPAPVRAGVIQAGEDGSARVVFHTEQRVATEVKFNISLEPSGGSQQPTGAVVLASE